MHYALYCKDKPNSLELRKATREAHIEYVHGSGKMIYGKPMLSDDGDMIGSLVIINVENRAAAEAFAANDPYAKAGLFESVVITRVAE